MLAKLLKLVEPLKNLGNKATILRLGLAGVVLGVGGFAVYKGVQQMKPSRPAPKRTETAIDKLKQEQDDLDPTRGFSGKSPVRVVSGQGAEGDPSGEPLYVAGDEQNPAAAAARHTISDQGGGDESVRDDGGVPQSPLQGSAGDEQSQYGGIVDEREPVGTVRPGRMRTQPATGTQYGTDDQAAATHVGDGQAATGAADDGGSEQVTIADGGGEAAPIVDGRGDTGDGSHGATADSAEAESTADVRSLPPPQTLPGVTSRRTQSNPYAGDSARGSSLRTLDGRLPAETDQPGAAAVGGGVPGDRQLEGTQVPSVAIEKFAPAEIQVGKSATFEIRVRNTGQVAAHDVVVTDQVPRGTKLEATSPEAQVAADGSVAWQLGAMQPGDEVVLSMQVLPEQEGEIGSVAQLTFAGRATARSVCTRPMVSIEHTAPKQVLIGETVRLGITISNPGTGAATGVIVEEDVPEGLTHVAGSELEYEIGTLRPSETRQLELQLTADKPGLIENMVTVRGEGNLLAQHKVQIEVIAPQLEVAVSGPKKRYLERQATYTLSIANPGTAAARSVELAAFLPKGMKFFSTDAEGRYDPAQHAVFWSLEELPANKSGSVNLVAVPIETGEQRLRVEGKADLGLTAASEQAVQVEARSELVFDIVDVNDPIEVGTDTTYEVRVANNGTRPATAVELAAGFPPEIKPTTAEGHSRGVVKGQQVTFEPVGRINPGEEIVFRIHAQGAAEGDHVIAVQIRSAEFPTPVTREESTRVYVDR
jgi:uncharacterized repeat protein (TIGR01451 family)